MFVEAKSLVELCCLELVEANSQMSCVATFPACYFSYENANVPSSPISFGIMLTCSPSLSSFHLPLISFIAHTDIIGVLRDFEVPPACDSGTSSILFGWHKSAGHSSLVHLGLGSLREDSRAERAAVYESAV